MAESISVGDVFAAAASLISDPDPDVFGDPEYDRGVTELVCTLLGLEIEDKAGVFAYLRSVREFENEKARMDSLIYRRNN